MCSGKFFQYRRLQKPHRKPVCCCGRGTILKVRAQEPPLDSIYHPKEYVVTFKVIKYSFRHLHHAAFQLLKYCKAKEKVKLCCTKPVCYNNILDAHTKLNQPSYRSHAKESNQLVEFVFQVCACQCPDPLL